MKILCLLFDSRCINNVISMGLDEELYIVIAYRNETEHWLQDDKPNKRPTSTTVTPFVY